MLVPDRVYFVGGMYDWPGEIFKTRQDAGKNVIFTANNFKITRQNLPGKNRY